MNSRREGRLDLFKLSFDAEGVSGGVGRPVGSGPADDDDDGVEDVDSMSASRLADSVERSKVWSRGT